VNDAACTTLGYSKKELLQMKMSDIKSSQFVDSVQYNREKIIADGSFQFESEHITKDRRLVSVEFISRLITYNNEKFILSVVRNISRRRKEERQVLSAVIQAEEKERQRFAKDMHDGLGPLLSTIKLYVNELKSDNLPLEEKEQLIQYSNELLDEAVESTRNISNNMMPNTIHSYGLIKAVENFCNKVNKTNAINIKFETEGIYERIDQKLELIFFRVISELINNTLKHAKATTILILLYKKEDTLVLNFKDDGIGFNVDDILTDKNKGMGLKNIISRIKSINGKYYFNSSPNKGFTIRIEVRI
jgi:PAS domain S-box-containing protein